MLLPGPWSQTPPFCQVAMVMWSSERLLDGVRAWLSGDTPEGGFRRLRGLSGRRHGRIYSDRQGFTRSRRVNSPSLGRLSVFGRGVVLSALRGNRSVVRSVPFERPSGGAFPCWTGPTLRGTGYGTLFGIALLELLCRPERALLPDRPLA